MIKILVIDDDKLICKHLLKYLGEQLGHQVFGVTNPLEAMDIIEKEAPHLVLLDVFMKELNGLDLLRQIKDKYGNMVKVIMITVAGDTDENTARALGADDFIRKPFDRDYLRDVAMEKIQEALGYRKKNKPDEKAIPLILVVDDEQETIDEIKYFLNRVIDCKVDTALNGNEAYVLLEKKNYDLMFLDIKMPGMNGLDLMRKVKQIKSLPDTFIVSGYTDGELHEQVKAEGVLGYIPKPIYLENFKRLLKDTLSRKNKYFEKGS